MTRTVAEIIQTLPESDRVLVTEKLASLDRKLEHRREFDAAVADSLVRILKGPLGKSLRDKIKELAANANG
jgi:hypothetical protein